MSEPAAPPSPLLQLGPGRSKNALHRQIRARFKAHLAQAKEDRRRYEQSVRAHARDLRGLHAAGAGTAGSRDPKAVAAASSSEQQQQEASEGMPDAVPAAAPAAHPNWRAPYVPLYARAPPPMPDPSAAARASRSLANVADEHERAYVLARRSLPARPYPVPSRLGARSPASDAQAGGPAGAEARGAREGETGASSAGGLTLAHKVTTNLASLCYHHLSPHTRMMRPDKRRGGSSSANPASSSSSSTASAARRAAQQLALFDPDSVGDPFASSPSSSSGAGAAPEERIRLLTVPPKPIVGPKVASGSGSGVGSSSSAGAGAKLWNGQRPPASAIPADAPIPASTGEGEGGDERLARLERKVSALRERYEAMRKQLLSEKMLPPSSDGAQQGRGSGSSRPSSPSAKSGSKGRARAADPQAQAQAQVDAARLDFRTAAGELKALRRAAQRAAAQSEMLGRPMQTLAALVAQAQRTSGAWLGAKRFEVRARGGWLPP